MTKLVSIQRLVTLALAAVSWTAVYLSYTTGNILAYNDATAHLNTARRIIDNLTPGFVQIGSVWLPMLHLLELPFVANFFLWQSGLAGSIVSSASFIASGVFLYKLTLYLFRSASMAIVAVAVFALNPNILYLQTTAMFEPLMMVFAIGAIYYVTRWVKEKKLVFLVLTALFTMFGTLTRYDGWAFFIAISAFVFLFSFFGNRKSKEGSLILFVFLAGFGIFLWFLYNYLIFNDPLYFQSGEFSAAAQQQVLAARGSLPTKGNLNLSILTYSIANVVNIGVVTLSMFVIGLAIYIGKFFAKPAYWAPLLLLVPYGFNIISLYLGQPVIWMPMVAPYLNTYFNARYGILLLPAVAFFTAMLAGRIWLLQLGVIAATVVQFILFMQPDVLPLFGHHIGVITLQDTVSSVNVATKAASSYLHEHHDGGLIMVSSASADAFIFRAGIPLKYFITEGTGLYWKQSLQDPTKYASWLVFFNDKSDRVGKVVGNSPSLKKNFDKVYEDATYQIWKKKTA